MIDTQRSLTAFDPVKFGQRFSGIDVIGAGALGSRITMSLAKLGLLNAGGVDIRVFDPDVVEAHNIGNQIYGILDIGKSKVQALFDTVYAISGGSILASNKWVKTGAFTGPFRDVLFLMVDSMAGRREIVTDFVRISGRTQLVIEARMGISEGRIYAFNPLIPEEFQRWESTLYSDDVGPVSACGSSISVGPTAEMVSGFAVWTFIQWFTSVISGRKEDKPPFEFLFCAGLPLIVVNR